MPAVLGKPCRHCLFPVYDVPIYHLPSLHAYFPTSSKLLPAHPAFRCVQPEVQGLPHLPSALVQLLWPRLLVLILSTRAHKASLFFRPVPCDCGAPLSCPWSHPPLSSLRTCHRSPPCLICRYFPLHCPVLPTSHIHPTSPQSFLLPATQWRLFSALCSQTRLLLKLSGHFP